ncbi:hypothetical protein D0Z07_7461 [Hyphodiscus hymeniophilus]|uniref:Clavaminate synthase-like protein n=1 Tax=Hyphodiscus hymeniophilus TaxID=353542 RepID=A0A9P6VEX5_9HELO|nr:hypothetical protein D0Z07_7461 [Hyphodiscus hymeniophilus]
MTVAAKVKSITSGLLRRRSADNVEKDQTHDQHVQNDEQEVFLPPLRPVALPKVLPSHQYALSEHGWTTVTYNEPTDNLHEASQALFQASQAFFDLPQSYKETFKTEIGSEEGWSRIEGEKELITLRCLGNTPKELKEAASAYWAEAGGLLNETLGRISESLGLPAKSLTQYSEPCAKLGSEKTATMLRLFRYEGFEGKESKTVAEPHRDLGLLSLVNGDTPGLEVWDRNVQKYYQLERTYARPAGSLLVGRQLERLSNGRYVSGGHLVRSYPEEITSDPTKPPKPSRPYRFSIVFVLRAHSPIPVDTDNLTTSITGPYKNPLRDITANELFSSIQSAHFNINTHIEEREVQRQRLAEQKRQLEETKGENEKAVEYQTVEAV